MNVPHDKHCMYCRSTIAHNTFTLSVWSHCNNLNNRLRVLGEYVYVL